MKVFFYIFMFLVFFPARAEIIPYFTPSLQCENEIVALADGSAKNIDIAIYALTNKKITDALKRAYDRGVKIRILADKTQAGGRHSTVIDLYSYGMNIKVNSKHRTQHNKYAIFDRETVVTGSYNWTASASKSNSENCLFIRDEDKVTEEYIKNFNYLWKINPREKSKQWFFKRVSFT